MESVKNPAPGTTPGDGPTPLEFTRDGLCEATVIAWASEWAAAQNEGQAR